MINNVLSRILFLSFALSVCSVHESEASDLVAELGQLSKVREAQQVSAVGNNAGWKTLRSVEKILGVGPVRELHCVGSVEQRMIVGLHDINREPNIARCLFMKLRDDGRLQQRDIEAPTRDTDLRDYYTDLQRVVLSLNGFKLLIYNARDRSNKRWRSFDLINNGGNWTSSDLPFEGDIAVDDQDRVVAVSEILKRCGMPFDASKDIGSLARMPQDGSVSESVKKPWFIVSNGSEVAFTDAAGSVMNRVDLQGKCKKYGMISRLLPLSWSKVVIAFSRDRELFSLDTVDLHGIEKYRACFFETDKYENDGKELTHLGIYRPIMARVSDSEIVLYDWFEHRVEKIRLPYGKKKIVAFDEGFGKGRCTALAVSQNKVVIGATSGLYMCDLPGSDRSDQKQQS